MVVDWLEYCRALALRYRDPNMYDDLVSEGVLEYLECKNEGIKDEDVIKGRIRLTVNNFRNIKSSQVNLPTSGDVRKVYSHLKNHPESDVTVLSGGGIPDDTLKAISAALYGLCVDSTDEDMHTPSHEDFIISKHLADSIIETAKGVLTDVEYSAISCMYFQGELKTPNEVAEMLSVSRQRVSTIIKSATKKLALKYSDIIITT